MAGEKQVKITINSFFNGRGFQQALVAVQGLQQQLTLANDTMREVTASATQVSRQIDAAATSMKELRTEAGTASRSLSNLADNSNRAAEGMDQVGNKAFAAAVHLIDTTDQANRLRQALGVTAQSARTVAQSVQQSAGALRNQGTAAQQAAQGTQQAGQAAQTTTRQFQGWTAAYQQNQQAASTFLRTLPQVVAQSSALSQLLPRLSQRFSGVVADFRTARVEIARVTTQFSNLYRTVSQLASRLGNSLARSLTSGVMRAVRSIGQLISAGARFAGLRSSLDSTGRSAQRFGADFEKGMDRANRSAMEFYAAGWSLLMGGQMVGGFGRRILGRITGGLGDYLEYEQARTKLGIASMGDLAPTSGNIAQHNELLNQTVFGLQRGQYGAALPMDAQSIAQGLYYYASAIGSPMSTEEQAAQVARAITPMLGTAAYTQTSPETVIKGVLNAAMEFGVDPRAGGSDKILSNIAAQFGYLTQVSTLELPDIVETFKQMGPMLDLVGGTDNMQNLNDAMLMTFLTSEMGLRGSRVGTGLAQAINSLIDPTDKMNEISQSTFGGSVDETFFDGDKHLKGGITGFLSNFLTLDDKTWKEVAASMFTTNATRNLIPIIEQLRNDPEKVAAFANQIGGDEPMKLQDAAMKRYNDSVQGHLTQMRNAWFEVQTAIVDSIQGPLKKALAAATHLFRELSDIVKDHPGLVKFFTTLTAGLGIILSVVGSLLTMAGTLLIIRRAFMMTHGAVTILFHVFAALPALLAVGIPLLLALGAAAVLLHRAWESNFLGIQDIVARFTGDLSFELEPILDNLEKLARKASEVFSVFVNAQVDRFIAWLPTIRDELDAVLAVLAEFGMGAVEGVGAVFLTIMLTAQQAIRVLRQVPSALKWVGQTIREMTGLNVSIEQVARALGFAFGVVMVGLAVRSLRVFNNEVTRGTLRLVQFIAQNILLRGVLLTFQTLGRVAALSFGLIVTAIDRTIFALARFVAAQVAANAVAASSRVVFAGTFLGVIAIIGLVIAAFIHLMQTNQEFHDNVVRIFNSLKGIVLDFAQGVLVGLVAGFYAVWQVVGPLVSFLAANALPAIEGLLQAVARSLAPWSEWADRMNAAQYAGMALGLAITALVVKLGVDLVAAVVISTAKLVIMAATFAVNVVLAIYAAVAATAAWIAALGPLGIAVLAMIAAAAALILILGHFGVIQDPFKTITDSAHAAVGMVQLLWDWLHKTNEEQAQSDYKAARKDYEAYKDDRFKRGQSDANTYYQDRIVFPSDPTMQSAYESYVAQGGTLPARQWFDQNGRTVVNTQPDAEQQRLFQRVDEANTEAIRLSNQTDPAPRSVDTSVDGGTTSGSTGIAALDNLISGWSIDRILKLTGINMSDLQGQMSGVGSFSSFDEWEREAKEQAKKLYIGRRYKQLTKRDLDVDEHLQGMSNIPGVFPAGTSFVDQDALGQANQDYVDSVEGAAAEFDKVQATIDDLTTQFSTAIQSIDLPSALKGLFDPYTGGGTGKGTSVAEILGQYSGTMMTNLQNAVGSGVKLPWQNDYELLMDAAGSGNFLGTDVTGKNLHKALAPFLETFAAQSGVSVESLLADIPTFYAPEQYIGMGQADLMQAAGGLSPDMYKRLDTLGAGVYNDNGIDWQELANFGTANAAAGNLDWNLADFIAESWDISKEEAEAYIKNNQLDPSVITGQDFFDTKMYADTLGGQVNVLPQEWWDYLMEVTQDGADKTIEMTQSAFDALPDVVKIGFSNMGYSFVIGGNSTSEQAVATAKQIKDNIENTFGNIPDHLGKLLKEGWTAVDSDMDGLIEIRDNLGNLKFTIPAGDYQAWIESNDLLQKEKDRMQGLKDDLETLKQQIRDLSDDIASSKTLNDEVNEKFNTSGFGDMAVANMQSNLATLKQDAHDIRVDLGWITGEGGTPPKIDVAGMMPSSEDIQKIGAQAAQDFKTGFDAEVATVTAGDQSFKVKITLDREEMLSRLVDTQVQLMQLDDETYTAKIDIDRTDATTHYNEMVTALRDDYDPATWTTSIDVDKSKADTAFSTITTVFNTSWATKTWTTTLAATDNASTTIQGAIDKANEFVGTYTATIALKDYATWTLQNAVNLLADIDGRTATATVTTNHNDVYTTTKNAQGGMMFRGGMSLVGEYGPELVYLPGGSRVVPNNHSMGLLEGMVSRSVEDMVGTNGGFQVMAVESRGGAGGGDEGGVTVNFYGDNHFHNETDMDQLLNRIDHFYGKKAENAKRGQYGGDTPRDRLT